jgi:branched-chain amino acid transport system permease protein
MKGFTGELRRETIFEAAFWAALLAAYFLLPGYRVLGSQILILALFALSLDLVLGYAGILTLGHAAFLGLGAYTAGLLAVHGWGEPITGLLAGAAVAAIGIRDEFPRGARRGPHAPQVTLGLGFLLYEAANKAAFVTGGVDGLSGVTMWKLFGVFPFDLAGRTAYLYSLAVLFMVFLFLRRLSRSPFGLALRGIRENRARMPAIGIPVRRRLVAAFTLGAAIAGIAGALLAQTTQFVGLDTLGFGRSADS